MSAAVQPRILLVDDQPARLAVLEALLHDDAFIGTGTERRISEWETGAQSVTGWSAASDLTLSHQAGFDRHLTKPVSRAALEQAIANAADVRAAGQA
jgi:CheY-like chemotaxis protein